MYLLTELYTDIVNNYHRFIIQSKCGKFRKNGDLIMSKDKKSADVQAQPTVKPVVTIPLTALQEKAKLNEQKRLAARKNRANVGIPVDPGVTFADLPLEIRQKYFKAHEVRFMQRLKQQDGIPSLTRG